MASTTAWTQAREQILQLCEGDAVDARTLRLEVLAVLRRVIGFDAYVWLLTDPETSVGSAPLADVPCLPELPRLIRLKYLTTVNRWTSMVTPVVSLSEATGVIMLVHLLTVVRYLSRINRGSSGRHGTSASGAEPTDVSGSVTSQT